MQDLSSCLVIMLPTLLSPEYLEYIIFWVDYRNTALINYMLANSLSAIHQKIKDIWGAFFQFSKKTLTMKFISVWKTLIPAAINGLNVISVKSYKMEQIQIAHQIRRWNLIRGCNTIFFFSNLMQISKNSVQGSVRAVRFCATLHQRKRIQTKYF